MIQPISFKNISFKGESLPNLNKDTQNANAETAASASDENISNSTSDKKTITSRYENAKTRVVNALKGVNNVTNTSAGAIRGVVEGGIVAVAVGVLGKNIKDAGGQISGTIKGVAKDVLKGAKHALLFIPSLVTKAPVQNIKDIVTLPTKFYGKSYLNVLNKAGEGAKTHKGTAALATLAGVGVLGLRTLKGKINANEKNAGLDHKTNRGHIK